MKNLLLFVVFFACLLAQGQIYMDRGILYDEQAAALVSQGKFQMAQGEFAQAVRSFDGAYRRGFNRSTTAAIYLGGLAYYYMGEPYIAYQRFDSLILRYPHSNYIDDAIYHKGLLELKHYDAVRQKQGLNDLFFLIDHSPRPEIRNDALNTARQFLFYTLPEHVVDAYKYLAPYAHRPLIVEAICFRRVETGRKDEAISIYNTFVAMGGPPSYFLTSLFEDQHITHYYEPNVMKIGLFLPLFLNQSFKVKNSDKIPAKSKMSLEFYEGFQKAIEDYRPYARKKIFVKVFDTLRDSAMITSQLSTMDGIYPDLVVGEVYNAPSKQISNWSERRGVPQVVPFSPTMETNNKDFLFLAHPSVRTHGMRMAEYARNHLRLTKVAVWTDGRSITNEISQGFSATFDSLGGQVIWIPIDSVFNRAKSQVQSQTKLLATQGFDGHYIPLPSEETSGLILSELNYHGVKAKMMGSPSWEWFDAIDQDLKDHFELLFTTSYIDQNDSSQYISFYNEFLKAYNLPPSSHNVQGYDLGMYLLQLLDRYDYKSGISLAEFIRLYGIHRGIHLDYHFAQQQDNQKIHICHFTNGRIQKVNRNIN